jgi:hypothetical protein
VALPAAFRVWLESAGSTHGSGHLNVRRSHRLRANTAVCALIAARLETDVPAD